MEKSPVGERKTIVDFAILEELEDTGKKTIIDDLRECQQQINELEDNCHVDYLKKRAPIELKYKQHKTPIFKQRSKCIKKIPKFWAIAMTKNPKLFLIIEDEEIDMLLPLTEMQVKYLEGEKSGFEIRFFFEKGSPYFKNKVISKCMWTDKKGNITTESSKIEWFEESSREMCKDGFFGWLENTDDLAIAIYILLLDLWENPLQYYFLPDKDVIELEEEEYKSKKMHRTKTILDDIEKYQLEINALNKRADREMRAAVTPIEKYCLSCQKSFLKERASLISKIPGFWKTALLKHPELSSVINKDEQKLLDYLIKIEVEHFWKDKKEEIDRLTKIELFFKENPYIENSVISKKFINGFSYGGGTCSNTTIKWKNYETSLSFQGDKMDPSSRTRKRKTICEFDKFFDWFSESTDFLMLDYIALRLLKFWQDPVKYYISQEVYN